MHGKYRGDDTRTLCGVVPDINNPYSIFITALSCEKCIEVLRRNVQAKVKLQKERNGKVN